jgi:hypothetical protein
MTNHLAIGLFIAGTLIASFTTQAATQHIAGPVLGFVPDPDGPAVRPIMGIPGASIFGERLQLDAATRAAVISPAQNYAIAELADGGGIALIHLESGAPTLSVLDGAHGADLIAFSPGGFAVALYDRDAQSIQVISNLPHAPEIIWQISTDGIPGMAKSVALSDDGMVLLLESADDVGLGLWVLDSSGAYSRVALDFPTAAAFVPGRRDAIVTDDASRGVYLILEIDRAAIQVPLISVPEGLNGFTSVAVGDDGRSVFLADAASGTVVTFDMTTGISAIVPCGCRPTILQRLKGTSIFQLTEFLQEPVMVLDVSTGEPRISVIPPVKPTAVPE